jgi:hypothetical protein
MAGFLARAARLTGLSAAEEQAAMLALGRDHPLARAASLNRTLAIQLVVATTVALLGIAGVLRQVELAPLLVAVAGVVAVALFLASLSARRLQRNRARELIAAGVDARLPVVERERSRLASTKHRAALARSLERLLHDAERWYQIPQPFRPLPGVECLRFTATEVRAVIARLRADHAHVQGIALAERFLLDGARSALYGGDVRRLREELSRIRYLLDAPRGAHEADSARMAA